MSSLSDTIFEYVRNYLFTASDNVFLSDNLDLIQGVATIVLIALVLALCVYIVVSVLRFLGRLFNIIE